jgi:hypothetical protein
MADLLEALNRLLKQGNDPNDPIMRELQRLIEEGAPEPPMPEVGRPTYKKDENYDPGLNWREEALAEKHASDAMELLNRGQEDSPDLPSKESSDEYMRDPEGNRHLFEDAWGKQRTINPYGPPEGYVPMPPVTEEAEYKRQSDLLGKGRPDGPDLPSDEAIQAFEDMGATDGTIQEFLDLWGIARTENPRGPDPNEIPMPRPRYPDLEEGPIGSMPRDPADIEGNLRASDYIRRKQEGSTTEDELQDLYEQLAPGEEEKLEEWQ